MPRGLPSGDTREGFALHLDWERALFDARYAVVSWPEEYGGRGATPMEWLIFEEEYYRAGGPQRVTQNGIFLLAPTVFDFGTPAQKDQHPPADGPGRRPLVPRAGRSPTRGATSPASRARRCATSPPGGWRLSGQKTWTTRGAFCTHLFGLFRSDPEAAASPRPHVLPRSARRRPGSRCGASVASTATRASPRSSSTTCSSPTTPCSARSTRAGRSRWRPRASSAGSPCAARAASWPPPTGSSTSTGGGRRRRPPPIPRCATRWCGRTSTPRPTAGRRSSPSPA